MVCLGRVSGRVLGTRLVPETAHALVAQETLTEAIPNVSCHVSEVSEAEPPSPVSSDSLTVQFARFQSELKRQHEAFLESGKIAELCESPRSCAAIFEYHMEQQESAERRKTMEAQSVAKPFDQF